MSTRNSSPASQLMTMVMFILCSPVEPTISSTPDMLSPSFNSEDTSTLNHVTVLTEEAPFDSQTSLDRTQAWHLSDGSDPKETGALHSSLESSMYRALESSMYITLESSMHSTLESSMHSTLDSNMHGTLESSMHGTLESSTHSTLESSMFNTLESSMYSTLESSTCTTFDSCSMFGAFDRHSMLGTLDSRIYGPLDSSIYDSFEGRNFATPDRSVFDTPDSSINENLDMHGTFDSRIYGTSLFGTLDSSMLFAPSRSSTFSGLDRASAQVFDHKEIKQVQTANDDAESVDTEGRMDRADSENTSHRLLQSVISEMEQVISWTDNTSTCEQERTWIINITQDHGITFQFHDVEMTHGRSVVILSYHTHHGKWKKERTFVQQNASQFDAWLNLSPLLVNHSLVKVVVNAARSPVTPDSTRVSVFNATFFAHAKSAMPPAQPAFDSSLTMYDCSLGSVPRALRCNLVAECEQGEDEIDCGYTRDGCDPGWIPHQQQCLKVSFMTSCRLSGCDHLRLGEPHGGLAHSAQLICVRFHGAQLAALPEQPGLDLVASVVRQSGFSSVSLAIKKFKPSNRKLHDLYRHVWQWGGKGGPVAYHRQDLEHAGGEHYCAMLVVYPRLRFLTTDCRVLQELVYPDGFVCSKPNPRYDNVSPPVARRPQTVSFARPSGKGVRELHSRFKECSDGSLVWLFERCLWGDMKTGAEWSPNNFPLFTCQFGPGVHYSLVCDGKQDCADGSDESVCAHPRFQALRFHRATCDNHQVISESKVCNGRWDCFDRSDEEECHSCWIGNVMCSAGCVHKSIGIRFPSCPQIEMKPVPDIPVPGVARLGSLGVSDIDPVEPDDVKFLFECHPGFYLPSYMLANGEVDCTGGKDEAISVENIVCPGYYRCQGYGNCVHPDLVCDSIPHCPNKDDELYCSGSCPENCTCEGFALSCRQMIHTFFYPEARYLDLSGVTDISFDGFHFLEFLRLLNLSRCDLVNITLSQMPHLSILDLSFNRFAGFSSLMLRDMVGLRYLDLTGNLFDPVIDSAFTNFVTSAGLVHLDTLIMKGMALHSIRKKPFQQLSKLSSLDLRGNLLKDYGSDVFQGLTSLSLLYTDESNLCCPFFHPTLVRECDAPLNELSSCADLVRTDILRVCLWAMAVLAVGGNLGVITYRLFSRDRVSSTFRVLVVNLCASDLLMGIYVVIIGSADVHYRGRYVSVDREWRHSAVCTMAGFLAVTSSEMSGLTILLITVDRLIVLVMPLKKHLHPTVTHTAVGCALAWAISTLLAAAPLMFRLQFYELNAVCVPLPITRQPFTGQQYAFAVFIILNFLLVLLIGIGQLLIYIVVQRAGSAAGAGRREQDINMARRLFLVVFSDLCCWFPVGVMGLLAAWGNPVPSVMNVLAAVFLLPFNSALNPFLYTLNGALQRRRKRRMQKKIKRMVGNLQNEVSKWTPGLVEETARIILKTKHVTPSKVQSWMGLSQAHQSEPDATGREDRHASTASTQTPGIGDMVADTPE